jgi:hypothetical protein
MSTETAVPDGSQDAGEHVSRNSPRKGGFGPYNNS